MKKTSLIVAFILWVSAVFAQGIVGDWSGALMVNGAKIRIIFHIVKNDDGYKSTMDSPDQHANGLPVGATTFADNKLTIKASQYGINYTGTYLPDSNKINGSFPQGGKIVPLNFTWSKSTIVARPQDPKDFPYKREEVAFDNPKGGDRLAGTLTMPTDGKASKIVVLITGSGAQNRDEELMNHRPFLVWSDWLTRHGIAVLRYDDRGTAQSTGNFATATSADFADDAEAAVSYIQSRPDLKNLSIGLMGHSEGGLIAPMVASRNKAVKFIVLLAGPGVPTLQLMVKQAEDQMRLAGMSGEAMKISLDIDTKLFDCVKANPALSTAELKSKLDTITLKTLGSYSTAQRGGKSMDDLMKANITLLNPWYRYFIAFNPADYLTKVKCPVLALDGTLDMQVNAEANLAGIKTSLEKAGNKNFEVVALPGLNHLFQKATTGAVAEYEQIPETVDPIALENVSVWINKL